MYRVEYDEWKKMKPISIQRITQYTLLFWMKEEKRRRSGGGKWEREREGGEENCEKRDHAFCFDLQRLTNVAVKKHSQTQL